MNEIINFVKEMFMLETNENEKCPVGLCGFEHYKEPQKKTDVKKARKKEMRLSELME